MERCSLPKRPYRNVTAEAKARGGDDEKVATTDVTAVFVGGVEVTSRYQKGDELEVMIDVLVTLDPSVRERLESLWCDSKGTAFYTARLRAWDEGVARQVGEQLESAFARRCGGSNGIYVEGPGDLPRVLEFGGWPV